MLPSFERLRKRRLTMRLKQPPIDGLRQDQLIAKALDDQPGEREAHRESAVGHAQALPAQHRRWTRDPVEYLDLRLQGCQRFGEPSGSLRVSHQREQGAHPRFEVQVMQPRQPADPRALLADWTGT